MKLILWHYIGTFSVIPYLDYKNKIGHSSIYHTFYHRGDIQSINTSPPTNKVIL